MLSRWRWRSAHSWLLHRSGIMAWHGTWHFKIPRVYPAWASIPPTFIWLRRLASAAAMPRAHNSKHEATHAHKLIKLTTMATITEVRLFMAMASPRLTHLYVVPGRSGPKRLGCERCGVAMTTPAPHCGAFTAVPHPRLGRCLSTLVLSVGAHALA